MGEIQQAVNDSVKSIGDAILISSVTQMADADALNRGGFTDKPARTKMGANKHEKQMMDLSKLEREKKTTHDPGQTIAGATKQVRTAFKTPAYEDADIRRVEKDVKSGTMTRENLDDPEYGELFRDLLNSWDKENKQKESLDTQFSRYQAAMQNKDGHARVKSEEIQRGRSRKQRSNTMPIEGGMNFD